MTTPERRSGSRTSRRRGSPTIPRRRSTGTAPALEGEVRRAFEICHGCRLCFKYCDSFPRLFSLLDEKLRRGRPPARRAARRAQVMDACFQCKLCEVQCPYTPRDEHEFQLDFPDARPPLPRRARRARASRARSGSASSTTPTAPAQLARLSLGLANAANRSRPLRVLMEKTVGDPPRQAAARLRGRAVRRAGREQNGHVRPEPGGEAVLFQTCFVQHNEPELGRDALVRARRRRRRRARGEGARLLRDAGVGARRPRRAARARRGATSTCSCRSSSRGAKVLVVNPTCSMMMRREWPHLLEGADRARAERLAPAVMDVSRVPLVDPRTSRASPPTFKSAPPGGKVAYHAPCHLRAQAIGFKGRDLLRKIPGVTVAATVHGVLRPRRHLRDDASRASSRRSAIGQKAFDGMKARGRAVWATDCPLAALQFQQHAGQKPLHPLSLLARAYRGERLRRGRTREASDEAGAARGDPRPLRRTSDRAPEIRAGRARGEAAAGASTSGGVLTFLFENAGDDALPGAGDDPRRADDAARRRSATSSRPTTSCSAAKGELGVSLLIEIPDPEERDRRLREWLALPRHLYLSSRTARRSGPRFDPRQVGDRPALLGAVPQVRRAGARPRRGRVGPAAARRASRRSTPEQREAPRGGPGERRDRAERARPRPLRGVRRVPRTWGCRRRALVISRGVRRAARPPAGGRDAARS